MVFKEYGTKKNETIMLLHGGGLSWWNYRSVAQQLQQDYRIILPVLDGHAGSGRKFTSIEDNQSAYQDIFINYTGLFIIVSAIAIIRSYIRKRKKQSESQS